MRYDLNVNINKSRGIIAFVAPNPSKVYIIMSVLLENENGWFIDTKLYFDKNNKTCYDENSSKVELKFRTDFFQIKTPFVMKSHALKLAKNLETVKVEEKSRKRIKNKKGTLQTNSLENAIITEKATCLIQAAKDLNLIKSHDISSVEWFENNYEARKAAEEILNLYLEDVPSEYYNRNDEPIMVIFGSEKYVLPAKSSFHLCDIKSLENLKGKGKKYDLIVLDPPWENKSVWRKKRYKTLDCDYLLNLPIDVICNPGCLIVVWVTNNKQQMNFIKEKLFPKWKVSNHVTWHWVKITQGGNFIHSIDWHHKKPYENLLLGYVSREFGNKNLIVKTEIEPHKVILSVPSSIHSHKPPLPEILKPYIPEDANCLELFARYLLPNWTSVGNEHIIFYKF